MNYINRLHKINLWQVLLSIVLFIAAIVFLLPMMADACGNIITPDSDFFYNRRRLILIGQSYNQANISAYASTRFTFDILWPLIYGFFMISTIAFMTKSFTKTPILRLIYHLPLLSLLSDFLENILCSLYFYGYIEGFTSHMAPIVSGIKWVLVFSIFLIQGLLFLITLYRALKKLLQ